MGFSKEFTETTEFEKNSAESKNKYEKFPRMQRIKHICTAIPHRSKGGDRGSGPPLGKSQVLWVSIEICIWTPPPLPPEKSWKKLDPPGKYWTPSETFKNYSFLWNKPLINHCKISWGLKIDLVRAVFLTIRPGPPSQKFLDSHMYLLGL